ncbi:MAG TPA: hypothetical protein VFI85_08800 [Methyloceanibacter sp.]|nr:hypothetical protein [Methyloceanibacter sp.]
MVYIRPTLAPALVAALLLLPRLALAEPQEPAAEENADETFAKSFLGKSYDDELEVEGWMNFGGGLVAPPIYVHQYQREEDGTYLVLTSREVAKASADTPASFVVTDALIVPKPQKDAAFSMACVQGEDATLKFMGEARGKEDKEWWSDVRRAWEISLETGEIASTTPKGIRCTNPNW